MCSRVLDIDGETVFGGQLIFAHGYDPREEAIDTNYPDSVVLARFSKSGEITGVPLILLRDGFTKKIEVFKPVNLEAVGFPAIPTEKTLKILGVQESRRIQVPFDIFLRNVNRARFELERVTYTQADKIISDLPVLEEMDLL